MRLAALPFAVLLAGCAAYSARPLPEQADLATRPADVKVEVKSLHLPDLKPHAYDPSKGLDMTDVAILAVVNNPALRTARSEARAARVQSFAAGLLPGPTLSASGDRPTGGNPPGLVVGKSLGLGYDLGPLFTSGAEQAAAEAQAQQADLDLLWAEWQVAQQARVLFLQCGTDRAESNLLGDLKQTMQQRYAAEQAALKSGDLAFDNLSVELAALQDVQTRADTLARQENDDCAVLVSLLGLAPGTPLTLLPPDPIADIPVASVDAALKELPKRRPDLVALRYGYEAQDEEVRRAVLAQFPSIGVGINRANDTSDVHTMGFSVSLSFPFVFGGAKQVHAAEADRDALWQAYQQRLDETRAEVHQSAADLGLLQSELATLKAGNGGAEAMGKSADAAYARGDLTAPAYYDLSIASLNRRLEGLDLETEAQQMHLALATLLGLPPEDLQHPIYESLP
ncbi:MAG TPA: TolC family protein [Gammaproteobacteria bacterium]|nr:TolC family protein [Gammaproteobacteria bacterium]